MPQEHLPPELVKEWVIAGHMNLDKVKELLSQHPSLLNAAYPWKVDDHETAIQAAAQMGNVPIAEFLLSKGAPLAICTAAMLGRLDTVEKMLSQDKQRINEAGAHGIPLLAHAALSGNVELVQHLFKNGASRGASLALHNAIAKNDLRMTSWLVENSKPDLSMKNYQGKTVLTVARERGFDEIATLLARHRAPE